MPLTVVLLWTLPLALTLGLGAALVHVGQRNGDRPGEAVVSGVEPDLRGRGVWITVQNPGQQSVLLGGLVRRARLRLRCEAGSFVTAPRRSTRHGLLASRYPAVCAVAPGGTETLLVTASEPTGRRAELVLTIGEAGRLRVVHRAVRLPGPVGVAPPAPTDPPLREGARDGGY